jgi:hypothetical protein
MKTVIFGLLMALTPSAFADTGLPALNQVSEITLQRPYSCNSMSYDVSALFLSAHSKSMNAPDLLYNGACGSKDYVQANTAGDDFALIADIGDVPLESVSASKAFNWKWVTGQDNIFKQNQDIKPQHTYAVLISKSDIRALYVFKVVSQEQDGPMTIRYSVKSYSIQTTVSESPGFKWQ